MVVLNSVEAAGVITMLCICAVDYAGAFSDTQYIIATSILRFFRTAVLLHNNRLAQIGLPDAVQSYYKRRGKLFLERCRGSPLRMKGSCHPLNCHRVH